LDSVQDDVDPAVDFDIDVPDINEVMEAEIYDEYNLSAERGFFATTFNADDVAQPVLHHRLEQCNFNTVHMEELESEKTPIPTMDTAIPSSTISTIQKQILSNLDVNKKFEVRTRKLSSVEGKRKLADLVDLYGWGLSAGYRREKEMSCFKLCIASCLGTTKPFLWVILGRLLNWQFGGNAEVYSNSRSSRMHYQ
jgi:hypothetical protein